LFYSGAGLCLRGLKDVLRDQLQVPLTEIDPFTKGLRLEQGSSSLRLPPFAYAAAAGAIARDMSEDSVRINLLPSDYVRSHDTTKRKRSLILTGSLAAALVICALVYANLLISSKERQLETVRAQADKNAGRESEIKARKNEIGVLRDLAKPEGSAMAILNDMSAWKDLFDPNEMHVAITEFQYTAGKTLGLSGTAMSYGEMNDLTVRLNSTRHFSEVKVESWGRDQNWYPGNVQPIRFKLNCYLGKTEQKGKKKEVEAAVASIPAAEQLAGKTP
jgi:Tfp pilus assembly protein PilN